MADFDHFVKGLGPHAKHYTKEQLQQLHIEVRKLAAVLLAAHKAKTEARAKKPYPQPALDGTGSDRTIEEVLVESAEGDKPSRLDDS